MLNYQRVALDEGKFLIYDDLHMIYSCTYLVPLGLRLQVLVAP